MATITATYDALYDRMRLTISGGGAGQTLRRADPNNVDSPVRSAEPLIYVGGGWAGDDYEFPHGATVTYEVVEPTGILNGTVTVTTPVSRQSWLKSPNNPIQNVKIALVANPALRRVRRRGVHDVLGREDPIVVSDVQSSRTGTLELLTGNRDADEALGDALELSPVMLLVLPQNARMGSETWVALGDVTETPLSPKFSTEAVRRTVEFTTVSRPPGGITGDPTASYQGVLDTYATYQQLRDGKATYLAVLRGVGTPIVPPSPGAF